MDILYLYKQPENKGIELKYSLRSISKYCKNIGNIYIVGDIPKFVSDAVTCIKCDIPFNPIKEKAKNKAYQTIYAIEHSNIADEFMISSDDHFYIKNIDFDNYPIYRKCYRNSNIDKGLLKYDLSSGYNIIQTITRRYLEEHNLPINMFDVHMNTKLTKQDIYDAMPHIKASYNSACGFLFESTVLNNKYFKKPFNFIDVYDYKYQDDKQIQIADNCICFSTSDFKENSYLHSFLNNLFPNKCIYEQ